MFSTFSLCPSNSGVNFQPFVFFSVIHNLPAAAPQPRGDEDGPGIGGPTPDGQPELGAEPT